MATRMPPPGGKRVPTDRQRLTGDPKPLPALPGTGLKRTVVNGQLDKLLPLPDGTVVEVVIR